MKNFQTRKKNNEKGQVMLMIVMLIGSSILMATTISGYLMLQRLRMSSEIVDSTKAILAADTGIEWELYRYNKLDCNYPKPQMTNDSNFKTSIDSDHCPTVADVSVRSIGNAIKSYRAFEINFISTVSAPGL